MNQNHEMKALKEGMPVRIKEYPPPWYSGEYPF